MDFNQINMNALNIRLNEDNLGLLEYCSLDL